MNRKAVLILTTLLSALSLGACGGGGGGSENSGGSNLFESCTLDKRDDPSSPALQCAEYTGSGQSPDAAETCGAADPPRSSYSSDSCSVVHAAETLIGTCYAAEDTPIELIFYLYVPTNAAAAEATCNNWPGGGRWELP